ncbi:MAG: ABC transporter substrate-binding protein [Anaerolineales bacterium]|nr:ABC transporter substrate-binding protein [Anaerolineales bacterium]
MQNKLSLLMVCVICLLVVSCGQSPSLQLTPEPMTLRVVQLPYLTFAPFYIAEKAGYFAEQGLRIEYVEMSGSSEAVAPLIQGELDIIAGTTRISLLNAISKGTEISIVADKGNINPDGCRHTTLMIRPALVADKEDSGAELLQGLRIAFTEASIPAYKIEKLLNKAGLSIDDIEIADIPSNMMIEALEKEAVDAVVATEPWVTRISESGQGVIWLPYEEILPEYQSAVVIYGPTILKDNPEAGKRFMVAYLKAVRLYNQGKTEQNVQWLAEFTGQDEDLLKEMCWPAIHNDGQIYLQSILDYQDWAVEKGFLDEKAQASQLWDSSYIDYANEVLDALPQ